MKASEFISELRSRLRDEDTDSTKRAYKDSDLLAIANRAYIEVSKEIRAFKKIETHISSSATQSYPMPNDTLLVMSVYLDGKKCEIKSFDWVVNNLDKVFVRRVAYVNYDGVRFLPSIDENGLEIKISFLYYKNLTTLNDELEISSIAHNSLLFYALFLAYHKETRTDSLKKAEYFYKLYTREMASVIELQESGQNSKNIVTKYQKI
jgi:competence protein ComGF